MGTPYDPRVCVGTSCGAPVAGACFLRETHPSGIRGGLEELGAIPVMGANRGLLRRIRICDEDAHPGNIDRDSDAWRGTMSNMHTTYPYAEVPGPS